MWKFHKLSYIFAGGVLCFCQHPTRYILSYPFKFSSFFLFETNVADEFFDFIECFTTTFLRTHSRLNWVDEDDDEDEVGLKERPEDTRCVKPEGTYGGVKCPSRRPPTTGS